MSRGPGQLQRTISEHLAAHPAPTTYETLRWELFEQGKRPTVAASDRLPAAWNTSFKRALDGLAERGQRRLIVERRHLETLEEFVAALSGQEPRRRHAAAAAHPWACACRDRQVRKACSSLHAGRERRSLPEVGAGGTNLAVPENVETA